MTERTTRRLLGDSEVVVGIVNGQGECQVEKFIKKLPIKFQARYQRYFEYLRDGIRIKSPENYRRLNAGDEPPVFEIKVDVYRVFLVHSGGIFYVTHGVKKPRKNEVNKEIARAIDIFGELELL